LSRAGDVKIIDYGLAWIKGENKGRVQGTPEYMAPEQARQGTVNEKTDIYNFGATMYRLATFRLPPSTIVASGSRSLDAQTFENNLKPAIEFNPQTPMRLNEIIHRCLSFDARQRPDKVSEVQQCLDRLVEKMVRNPEDSLEAMEW
jgi:serine/threonine protein kinase